MTDDYRRRIVALGMLLPVAWQVRADPVDPEGNPVETIVRDVGSWRVISRGNSSRAVLRDESQIVSKATADMPFESQLHGSASIRLGYWAAPGVRRGHHATLLVYRLGNAGSLPVTAHVLVAGEVVDTFPVNGSEQRDIGEWFDRRIGKEDAARELRVEFEADGGRFTIFHATLEHTARAIAEMQTVPDYNYRVVGLREPADDIPPPPKPADETKPRSGCFITTACCAHFGLGDECFELRALRNFRDRVLSGTAVGRDIVQCYYEDAPRLLAVLANEPAHGLWPRLYVRYLLPAALAARWGLDRIAFRRYVGMMRELADRYPGSVRVLDRSVEYAVFRRETSSGAVR